jgi:hypothetical protein
VTQARYTIPGPCHGPGPGWVRTESGTEVVNHSFPMATPIVAINKTLSLLDICDSTNNNNLWFVVLLLGLCGMSCIILLGFMFHSCILRTTTCCCSWRACCGCCFPSASTSDIELQKPKSNSFCWGGGRKSKRKPSTKHSADLVVTDFAHHNGTEGNEAIQAKRTA